MFNGFQLLTLFPSQAVHFLIDHFDQLADVALGQDVATQLLDDGALKVAGVEPRRVAGLRTLLDLRLTDIVRVLAALRLGRRHTDIAQLAADQTGQHVGTGKAPRVHFLRCARLHQSLYVLKLLCGHDGRVRAFDPHRLTAVLSIVTPDERPGVGLVGEQAVRGRHEPGLAGGGRDALIVERAGDVEHTLAIHGHVEDAPHNVIDGRVENECGTLLGAVLHLDALVSVRRPTRHPEPARRRLAHSACDLLSQILRVELIDRLDDRFHQLAGGRVVSVLGDRGDSNPAPTQHRLERHSVFTLSGEA